jgi:hypothetical protein
MRGEIAMDKNLMEQLDQLFDELQEFCTKTLAEVMVMRIQISLLKDAATKK